MLSLSGGMNDEPIERKIRCGLEATFPAGQPAYDFLVLLTRQAGRRAFRSQGWHRAAVELVAIASYASGARVIATLRSSIGVPSMASSALTRRVVGELNSVTVTR